MDIRCLPENVLNSVLYDFLDSRDVGNCLIAHRCFNVLSNYQKSVVIYASKGIPDCFTKIEGVEQPDILTIIKYMYKNGIDLYKKYRFTRMNSVEDNTLFEWSCINGCTDMARWLVSLNSSQIHILSDKDEYPFELCCINGHLELAKWLIEHPCKEYIDISTGNSYEYAFMHSCKNGHLEVAKWLVELSNTESTPIDINVDNNYAFITSSINGHTDVVNWLIEFSKE